MPAALPRDWVFGPLISTIFRCNHRQLCESLQFVQENSEILCLMKLEKLLKYLEIKIFYSGILEL